MRTNRTIAAVALHPVPY